MNQVMRRRRWRAVLMILFLFAGIGLSAHVEGQVSSGYALQAADALLFKGDVWGDDAALIKQTPEFMNEIGLPTNAYEAKLDKEVNTVGYLVPQPLDEFYPQLFSALRVRGWEEVESNLVGTGTFVKESGQYRWLFVTCVDVADSCSVVLQYQTKEG